MRQPIVAGNWKMNPLFDEARTLIDELLEGFEESAAECVVMPPFSWIVPIHEQLSGSKIKLGAQNCGINDRGAFTGEVSAKMLAPFCEYIIVGHSERRQYYKENDDVVRAKMEAVHRNKRRAILCVGESIVEREEGLAQEVVTRQLRRALRELRTANADSVVVAYEPVWAIGTGKAATPDDAQQMAAVIRQVVADLHGSEMAEGLRVQYGGSVTADNARSFLSLPDVDGALVGGASLKAPEFLKIVAAAG